MKKTIGILLLVMAVSMASAFAEVKPGDRISVYDNEGTTDAGVFHKVFTDNSVEFKEVVVCAIPPKIGKTASGKTAFALMPDISYLSVAEALLNKVDGRYSPHFECHSQLVK